MNKFIILIFLFISCSKVEPQFKYGDLVSIKFECISEYIRDTYKFRNYSLNEFNNAKIESYFIDVFNDIKYGIEVDHYIGFFKSECITRN